jgi:GTP cyclohydrolase I
LSEPVPPGLPPEAAPGPDRRLRVVPEQDIDLAEAQRGAEIFMRALGMDLERDGLTETPARMAKAWAEFFTPRSFDLTTFPNDEGYGDLVLARDIPFRSVCEHHLLPFTGTAHVGYIPADRILGLSKLARVVELFASRPQVQERLTQQIANWLAEQLAPRGVGVVLEAEHSCMTMRGVRATGSSTVTSAMHGLLREDGRSRAEFLAVTGIQR